MGTFRNTVTTGNQIGQNQIPKNQNPPSVRNGIIDNTTQSMINRITNNPFYFFAGVSMTKVTFYNINKEHTTFDESVGNTNRLIGEASGLRFDKINGVILYGMPRIDLNINVGEWGTEADLIEGEAVLPPNTFKPYQESYFTIDYLNTNKTLWFRVNTVNIDTLPNGANYYKIQYHLEAVGKDITPQVINEYNYIADNIGTGNPVLVDTEQYNLMGIYDELIDIFSRAYYEMFFKENVQTFVFKYGPYGYYFWDPYLIEFMRRNGVLNYNGSKYVHVCQPAITPPYINMDYEHTLFRKLEDSNATVCFLSAYAMLTQDPMSLLTQRIEPYYFITMRDEDGSMIDNPLLEKISLFDTDLMNLIPGMNPNESADQCRCRCLDIIKGLDNSHLYYKIIYNFLSGIPITYDQLKQLKYLCLTPCKELYYTIPILIYIIKATMKATNSLTTQN